MDASLSAGRLRKDFSKIARIIDIPNLIDIQNTSFENFLQADVAPEKREERGRRAVDQVLAQHHLLLIRKCFERRLDLR